jgi:rhamnose utilization protein RhaD (predicted bifunctional aldolase and dehydrogenase)/NAD(P)-dependent dehydrogenase (short-subunit alcohol dehydrogenase family)
MQSLWNENIAAACIGDLPLRVYTSRLLGRDKSLVMHGGGNTSVKIHQPDLFRRDLELLYVKGSGWDLETIQPEGFSPVKMSALLELAMLETLSDMQMANELRCAMTDASAPAPSVEAILHAIIPYKFVDHTHADAVIAVTNTSDGRKCIEEIFGGRVVIIPYVMPGFKLARLCAERFPQEATAQTEGMILLKHGIFTFGETARESYERMIALVDEAEHYLQNHGAFQMTIPSIGRASSSFDAETRAAFRQELAATTGFPVIVTSHDDDQVRNFQRTDDFPSIAQQGPLTPDHVIRTKRLPLIGRDIEQYASAYEAYFQENQSRSATPLTMLDPAPRIVLDDQWGILTVGKSAKEAAVAEEIYRHTMEVIQRSSILGGYEALPAGDIFDVEYWDLEQAKLQAGGKPPVFTGEIALVTGAASGIGKACAEAQMRRGAAVVALDINPAIESLFSRPDYLGIRCDLTDEAQISSAIEATVKRYGGLDMVVLNAGIFPAGTPIANLTLADWDKVMRINLDSNLVLLREVYPLLKHAPNGGRVVIVGSKNVPAPGPGAAAYSASKAAITQLARVAALEWGGDHIRVNTVHPNAVFDTGLWTEEVLQNRAKHYGLTVDEYKTNNVLKVEVTSRDVGELVAELCGAVFSRTTGAQIPIDGGNDRVI